MHDCAHSAKRRPTAHIPLLNREREVAFYLFKFTTFLRREFIRAELDFDLLKLAGEFERIFASYSSMTGVPVSSPTSKLSSRVNLPNGEVCSMRLSATFSPSTVRVPRPPLPSPPPSYLKSKPITCLPGVSLSLPAMRVLSGLCFGYFSPS